MISDIADLVLRCQSSFPLREMGCSLQAVWGGEFDTAYSSFAPHRFFYCYVELGRARTDGARFDVRSWNTP